MSHAPDWDQVSRDDVVRAIEEYDQLGPDQFFAQHGFAPTTTYELIWNDRSYPPKGPSRHRIRVRDGPAPCLRRFRRREGGRCSRTRKVGVHRPADQLTIDDWKTTSPRRVRQVRYPSQPEWETA
jgi:hypothetical protein